MFFTESQNFAKGGKSDDCQIKVGQGLELQ